MDASDLSFPVEEQLIKSRVTNQRPNGRSERDNNDMFGYHYKGLTPSNLIYCVIPAVIPFLPLNRILAARYVKPKHGNPLAPLQPSVRREEKLTM